MKSAKPILGAITLFLAAVSVWMKITSFEGRGTSYTRTEGVTDHYTMNSFSMLLIALIFSGTYLTVDQLEREKKA
jgi:hypothetical protein